MGEILPIITAFGLLLTTLGGGAGWLLNRIEAKTLAFEKREGEARQALNDRLQVEIKELNDRLNKMQEERSAERSLFMQRVYQLERFIHMQPGISVPEMTGWPPKW